MERKRLSMEERVRLAEEGLDKTGRDARIIPPLIYVDENGYACDLGQVPDNWEELFRKSYREQTGRDLLPSKGDFDYAGFAEARCPAPPLSCGRYIKTSKITDDE